jgi:CRP-like cAMP-binding protein
MTAAERAAYMKSLSAPKSIAKNQAIIREGDSATRCAVLLNGFAARSRVQPDGQIQILSFVLPGDICDLQSLILTPSDHSIISVMPCRIAYLPHAILRELITTHPRLGYSFWRETLIDAAIFREWMVNIASRDAYTRLAHLLCEIYTRMAMVGLIEEFRYALPLSQQLLAEATGLTVVHVNRTLKRLKAEGLVTVKPRAVAIHDWQRLAEAGQFDPRYLYAKGGHKPQPDPPPA